MKVKIVKCSVCNKQVNIEDCEPHGEWLICDECLSPAAPVEPKDPKMTTVRIRRELLAEIDRVLVAYVTIYQTKINRQALMALMVEKFDSALKKASLLRK